MAIRKYDDQGLEAYSRNTFLVYDNKQYPAKHIRAMAYELAFNEPADKSNFSGGKETVDFFEQLGFTVDYKANSIKRTPIRATNELDGIRRNVSMSHHDVIEQKNALQLHLNRYFKGDIVSEKTYDWLKTPDVENQLHDYRKLIKALKTYRGHANIGKSNYKLRCDFVSESHKTIIEYDERQHFTKARQISLENYPEDVIPNFNVGYWIDSCKAINARDNHPSNRDEVRAFYDSVRDIESFKHGYRLIRIKHGDYDWESDGGQQYLQALLKPSTISKANPKMQNVSSNHYDWRSLEIEIQRIRLIYLKWLFHFTPKPSEALNTMKDKDKIYLLNSPYGRSFSLSPAGPGSVYAGGGKGVVKLPLDSYRENKGLLRQSERVKVSLDRKVKQLKQSIESLIKNKHYELAWEYLQNFWWLRLGLHEYVFDVQFHKDTLPKDDVREYVLASMYNKMDLSVAIPTVFTDDQMLSALSHKFSWSRYGMCSYDCGPLAVGRNGFVPYKIAAQRVQEYFRENTIELEGLITLNHKRDFAVKSLMDLYDFQLLYHQEPLSFWKIDGFNQNKAALSEKIDEVDYKLQEIIDKEGLNVG
jgi:very-short-patch-repair endonuclease